MATHGLGVMTDERWFQQIFQVLQKKSGESRETGIIDK